MKFEGKKESEKEDPRKTTKVIALIVTLVIVIPAFIKCVWEWNRGEERAQQPLAVSLPTVGHRETEQVPTAPPLVSSSSPSPDIVMPTTPRPQVRII